MDFKTIICFLFVGFCFIVFAGLERTSVESKREAIGDIIKEK